MDCGFVLISYLLMQQPNIKLFILVMCYLFILINNLYAVIQMVWIETKDKIYLNSELITSFAIEHGRTKDRVAITCHYGEFYGECIPTSIELWHKSLKIKSDSNSTRSSLFAERMKNNSTCNDHNLEIIDNLAKDIMIELLTELDAAKKKGMIVFNLEAFLKKFIDRVINK
jgi:hypothetical protein